MAAAPTEKVTWPSFAPWGVSLDGDRCKLGFTRATGLGPPGPGRLPMMV